jgi:DNA-directed RNA polymerase alpha subunit
VTIPESASPALSTRAHVRVLWPDGPKTQTQGRALNALKKDGITSIGSLTGHTAAYLLSLESFGPRCLADVRERLAGHGLRLAGDPEGPYARGESGRQNLEAS